ncbi:BspA family leucine-rich repeat surface protein, partial [Enterococcus faecium]|nr:BspA family leucine-rich repeat surface protein [Enterococcus faecium]
MFACCNSLTNLDVSKWDTSNVTDMSDMFGMFVSGPRSSLTNLDVSKWDTSNVTNMSAMFRDCKSLTTLDVSDWDTS